MSLRNALPRCITCLRKKTMDLPMRQTRLKQNKMDLRWNRVVYYKTHANYLKTAECWWSLFHKTSYRPHHRVIMVYNMGYKPIRRSHTLPCTWSCTSMQYDLLIQMLYVCNVNILIVYLLLQWVTNKQNKTIISIVINIETFMNYIKAIFFE